MKILVDADACPKGVKKACEELSIKYSIELVMIIDDAHELDGEYSVIKVGKGKDAVDIEIVRQSEAGDIIITQDYGLATILLDKAKAILHPDGFLYTKWNIDTLMFQRHMGQKLRNSGGRTRGPKKRKDESDIKFRDTLEEVIKKFSS